MSCIALNVHYYRRKQNCTRVLTEHVLNRSGERNQKSTRLPMICLVYACECNAYLKRGGISITYMYISPFLISSGQLRRSSRQKLLLRGTSSKVTLFLAYTKTITDRCRYVLVRHCPRQDAMWTLWPGSRSSSTYLWKNPMSDWRRLRTQLSRQYSEERAMRKLQG